MKKILSIAMLLLVMVACKKETIEPEPTPEPIKTSKSFTAQIQFTSDSLQTHYITGIGLWGKARTTISIDTIPNVQYGIQAKALNWTVSGSIFTLTLNANLTTTNLNRPLTYYIYVQEQLYKLDSTMVIYQYQKTYTFSEGNNGIINFNTLP